jgi:hypothetical protein
MAGNRPYAAGRPAGLETAPPKRPVWVGDFWDMFGAGHLLELKNLKAIAEYPHRDGLPGDPGLDEMTNA